MAHFTFLMRPQLVAVLLSASVVYSSGVASAQAADEFLSDPSVEAQQLYVQAQKLQAESKHSEALPLLEKALMLHKRPDIAAALGETEAVVEHHVEAARHLTYALSLLPPGEQAERAAEALKKVRPHVCSLRIKPTPAMAVVTLDDQKLPQTNGEIIVLSGEHNITAEATDYRPTRTSMHCPGGGSETVSLVLKATGTGAEIPSDSTPVWPWIAGVGGALTLGAIVAGAVLTGSANDHDETARDLLGGLGSLDPTRGICLGGNTTICDQIAAERSNHDDAQNAATSMWVTASVLGVGTIVGAVLSAQLDDHEHSAVSFQPVVGQQRAGLQLSGRW